MPQEKLTVLSRKGIEAIPLSRQNAAFVKQYITEDICQRKFSETLGKYAPVADPDGLRTLLVDELTRMNPGAQRDSIRRKVALWLGDKNAPEDRTTLIQLCFAMRLNELDAQNFLASAGGGCLHRRNPEELTYLYALRMGLDYEQSQRMLARVRQIMARAGGPAEDCLTHSISQRFDLVRTEEDFYRFIEQNRMSLGMLHNTAYAYYCRYMRVLTNPTGALDTVTEEAYTVRDVVDMYLRVAPGEPAQEMGRDMLRKTLLKHWPNESSLSRIAGRQMDVPRKVLTLLFLITDGAEDEPEDELIDENRGPRRMFIDRYQRVNAMLDACGYSALDPRNPFDWLALYCMYVGEDGDVSERMRSVLADIFA